MLNRYKQYSIDEVRKMWENARYYTVDKRGKKRVDWKKINIADDIYVKMNSQRYQVFFELGTKCSCCGIEGKYFWLEQDANQPGQSWHFNLYAVRDDGTEVLMTKDHIIPRSKGGKNHIDNYCPMCAPCNVKKGDK